MRGIVKFYEFEKWFGVIKTELDSFLVLHKDIYEDNAGRRFLQEGEEVNFDLIPDEHNGKKRLRAVNVRVLDRPDEDLENYYEDVKVKSFHGHSGFGQRFTNDSLFLLRSNIVTTGQIQVGDYVRCRVGPPDREGHKIWIGVDIQIYLKDESEAEEVEEVQSEKQ